MWIKTPAFSILFIPSVLFLPSLPSLPSLLSLLSLLSILSFATLSSISIYFHGELFLRPMQNHFNQHIHLNFLTFVTFIVIFWLVLLFLKCCTAPFFLTFPSVWPQKTFFLCFMLLIAFLTTSSYFILFLILNLMVFSHYLSIKSLSTV